MATLKEMIEFSAKNPKSPQAKVLLTAVSSGKMDEMAKREKINLTGFKSLMTGSSPGLAQGLNTVAATRDAQAVKAPIENAIKSEEAGVAGQLEDVGVGSNLAGMAAKGIGDTVRSETGLKAPAKKQWESDATYGPVTEAIKRDGLANVLATAGDEAMLQVAELPEDVAGFGGDIARFLTPESIEDTVAAPFEAVEAGAKKYISDTTRNAVEGLREKAGVEASPVGETIGGILGNVATGIVPAAKGAQIGAKLGNAGKLAKLGKAGQFAGASAGSTLGGYVPAGRLPSAGEIAAGGAIDVALAGLLKVPSALKYGKDKAFTKIVNKSTADIAEMAKAKGIIPDEIDQVIKSAKQDPDFVDELFANARARQGQMTVDGAKPLDSLDIAGKNVKTAASKLFGKDSVMSKIGAELGEKFDALPKNSQKISTESLIDPFMKKLEKLNIRKIDPKTGKPSFSGSSIESNAQDKDAILKAWNSLVEIKEGKVIPKVYDPRTIQAKKQDLGNFLYASAKADAPLTQSKSVLEGLRKDYDDIINQISPEIGELNAKYSELINAKEALSKKLKADNIQAPEILKRLWGSADSEYVKLVQDFEGLAKKYNIPEGLNLIPRSALAVAVDKATGIPPTSIGSAVSTGQQTMEALTSPRSSTVQQIVEGAGKTIDKFRGVPESKLDALSMVVDSVKRAEKTPALIGELNGLAKFAMQVKDVNLQKMLRALMQAALQEDGE